MQDREEKLTLAKVAQKADFFSEDLGVLEFMIPIAKKDNCFGMSWDERRLTEFALKTLINRLRKAIEIVASQEQSASEKFKVGLKRYEMKLKM